MAEFIRKAKSVPCADCGQSFPYYVMDFDHRPDEKKEFLMVNYRGVGQARLEQEMAKCDVVCSNCHRIRTYSRKFGGNEHTA
jgi:hypothetical protein